MYSTGQQIASPTERFQMSAAYRLNVVSTARAELFACREASAALASAALASLGTNGSAAAVERYLEASAAVHVAADQFEAAWAFASGR